LFLIRAIEIGNRKWVIKKKDTPFPWIWRVFYSNVVGVRKKKTLSRKNWNKRYFILRGGSLFYYNTSLDYDFKGEVRLKNCKFEDQIHGKDITNTVKYVFCLTTSEFPEFWIAALTEEDKKQWVQAIAANLGKDPSPPPDREEVKKKGGLVLRAKKKLAGKLANTDIGRNIVNQVMDDETVTILDLLQKFCEKDRDEKMALRLQKNIIKTVVKIGILSNEKQITEKQLLALRIPIVNVLFQIMDYYEISFSFDANELHSNLLKIQVLFENLLGPLLTKKSIDRIKEVAEYYSSVATLAKLFTDPEYIDYLQGIYRTLKRLHEDNRL